MSTITRAFTKEQLIEHIKGRKEFADECAADSTLHPERREYYELTAEALRIALASLEAEAAYFINRVKHSDAYGEDVELRTYCYELDALKSKDDFGGEIVPVYTVPPAPFALPVQRWEDLCRQNPDMSIGDAIIRASWWNHCAAMLQGAEPVTTAYKLPDDFDFDRFNEVVWLDAVASNPHMHSLTTSTIAMVALELNRKLANGNSPVSPDGWVACSERIPEQFKAILAFNEYGEVWSGAYDRYWNFYCDNLLVEHVTHWMPLPSAPQQEAQ